MNRELTSGKTKVGASMEHVEVHRRVHSQHFIEHLCHGL